MAGEIKRGPFQLTNNPAATVASTPEPPSASGTQKAAKGVSSANTISTCGSLTQRRRRSALQPMNKPQPISPTTTAANSPAAAGSEKLPPSATARIAKLNRMSAVASFTSPSPSSTVRMRLGTAKRRAIAIGATASGGDTTAPSTKPTAQGTPSAACITAAVTSAVKITQPTASERMGCRFCLKPRQLMPTPDE